MNTTWETHKFEHYIFSLLLAVEVIMSFTFLGYVHIPPISITTAQEHDKRIAFTSQMAHVISNAYIKSPTARNHDGFSAGSYKDLTRVAWLNPAMWAELFLENRENLLFELDTLIRSLEQYREAIQEDDFAALCQLLEEGRRIKEEVDGT